MATNRKLSELEAKELFKAVEDFIEKGNTNITCPKCNGILEHKDKDLSFLVICKNCGIVYSGRGI